MCETICFHHVRATVNHCTFCITSLNPRHTQTRTHKILATITKLRTMQITTIYLVLKNSIQYFIWEKNIVVGTYCCPEISDLRTECVGF